MQPHDLGRMQHGCPHCQALHWQHEATSGSVGAGTASYGMCCMHGTVQLPALGETPQFLRDMLSGETPASKRFLENIRRYNAVFQMASTGWALCFTTFHSLHYEPH